MAGRGRGQGAPRPPPPVFQPSTPSKGPDPAITKSEDDFIKGSSDPTLQLSGLSLGKTFPLRPGYGESGRSIQLFTNHFTLSLSNEDLRIYRYEFSFTPATLIGRKKARIIQKFLLSLAQPFRGCCATDFKRYLFTVQEIPKSSSTDIKIVHTLEKEDEPDLSTAPANQIFYVTLLGPTVFYAADLLKRLRDPSSTPSGDEADLISSLNTITSFDAKSLAIGPEPTLMATSANKHFQIDGTGAHIKALGQGLLAARGYLTSVRSAAQRLLLNVQIKHAAYYKDGRLTEVVQSFDGATNRRNPTYDMAATDWFLRSRRVSLHHLPIKRNRLGEIVLRVKSIHGLAKACENDLVTASSFQICFPCPAIVCDCRMLIKLRLLMVKCPRFAFPSQAKFKWEDSRANKSEWRSVKDHFRIEFSCDIPDKFPVINVGNDDHPVYYPMEVCHMLPGQPAFRDLSPEQTANMTKNYAVRPAHENANSIAKTSQNMLRYTTSDSVLRAFGLQLATALSVVPARVIAPPSVHYAGKPYTANFGAWNLKDARFCKPIQNFEYVVLRIKGRDHPKWSSHPAWSSAMGCFKGQMNKLGLGAKDPVRTFDFEYEHVNDDTLLGIEDHIKHQIFDSGWIRDTPNKPLPLRIILIVSSTENARLYKHVKTLMDTKLGARSVWVLSRIFCKEKGGTVGDPQIMANILMKWNLQLGGTNQKIKAGTAGLYGDGNTMFIGYDVTHPSPNSRLDAPSVAAYVADVEGDTAQYPAIYHYQTKAKEKTAPNKKQAEEPAHDLQQVTAQFLNGWQHYHSGKLPRNIIVYRDGVSEGQLAMVRDVEVPMIKAACDEAFREIQKRDGEKHRIDISVAVVGKRHHVRFHPTSSRRGEIDERSGSAPPGTVVDRHVTTPQRWDVYLQPHAAIQGTSKSAHYTLVHDDIFRRWPHLPSLGTRTANAADYFQVFTNAICSTYGRATRSVSLAPPAYYADLAAGRARCWLSKYYTPTPAERGDDNGKAAAAAGNFPNIQPAPRLRRTMHYI